jgi:1,2-phenylacetyl-CoA epoxidase catalytic subunit
MKSGEHYGRGTHIKKHLKNIKKYAERLKGKAREEALDFVRETAEKLRHLAEKQNYPWDI